ncbi:MAG: RluA family pseudouridine synthase [Gammaproteobacteria bacterium]|nr:RluA family pseudouridine synthase [Gammaproteobacteria bacterium]
MQKRGVEHVRIDAVQHGRRLDNFLTAHFGSLPKSRIYQMIRRGEVRVNGGRVRPDHRIAEHDDVRLPPASVSAPEKIHVPRRVVEQLRCSILYQDPTLLVLNKPAGLPVHSGSGQAFGVIDAARLLFSAGDSLQLVHRLDRDTSGCLLIARDHERLRELHDQFRSGKIRKRYTALLQGNLGRPVIRVDVPLDREARVHGERTVRADAGGLPSQSRFRVLRHLPGATLVSVAIATGRTHQIRVHAQHIGHPVAGDDRYGSREFNRRMRGCGLKRVFLHASSLAIPGRPGTGLNVEAPLPEDLERVLQRLASPVATAKKGKQGFLESRR